ncbi:ribonuclease J [Marinospirillum celere]|uniref:Ribonuclease J n=1 Tax=Marinospirillum celere TaxID=1122252 RepID=A0A1I1EXJ7_9GAMM|nr:ribonuclease J [Marinospirillum celere]SFB89670.1 ribonuclease J [Marinospirillum celere]
MRKPSRQLIDQQEGPFFLALGGAGEIGANLYIYGSQGYWLAVDCGQGFRATPGGETQTVVPDLKALEDNGINIQALLITHAHEDHIGALPWLSKKLNCPIYASPFSRALIEKKLESSNHQPSLQTIRPLVTYSFGPFKAEWIPVTHSIPEAHGIYLQAAGRTLYHTGDWKLDAEPLVGHKTAVARLQEIGQQGLDLVIGDSTNAPNPGHSASEASVKDNLYQVIQKLPNRVLVTCFASNVARLSSLGKIAQMTGRQLVVLGFSMEKFIRLGRQLNYLDDFPTLIPARDLGYLPRQEQMILCTGSQGEPRAALARLAAGSHPHLELEAEDQVIFSSKTIPGNEDAVARLHAQLTTRKIDITTEANAPIHASGHPYQDEIRQLYTWLKPKHLLAMHGEYRHQSEHCQLAKTLDINARVPEEGDIYDLSALPRLVAKVHSGRLLVQGQQLLPLRENT